MEKEKNVVVSFYCDKKLYERFRKNCLKNDIKISHRIEQFIQEFLTK